MLHPPVAALGVVRHRRLVITLAFGVVTGCALLDAAYGPQLVILGTLAAGPTAAAGSGCPRAVMAICAYTLAVINVLSWRPDRIWGTPEHIFYNVITIVLAALGVAVAAHIRATENAAGRAEKHWRNLAAVVAHSSDAIIASDLTGRIIAFNAGAERLYGYRAADVVGTPIASFLPLVVPPGTPEPSHDALTARVLTGERGIMYDAKRVHADGTVKDVSVTVSPVYDELGEAAGMSSVCRDVSAQKRAEEQSQQLQRMAALGQLAGGVAHDFNNLLGVILSFITFAEEDVSRPDVAKIAPDTAADLGKARAAGERAVALTRQLLTFTRQDTVHREDLDVNACLAEVQTMLARTIGENINLVVRPGPRPLMVHADAGQIHQVLLNLAVNARDAMPEGGTLVIEASATQLDDHHTNVHPATVGGRYVRLLVSDTGAGMSPDVAARIFEPFFTTKPKGRGTGLGLATVYGIVTEAGGDINVYSEPGIGTTFRVYLPVSASDTATRPTEPAAEPAAGEGRTVLIVEDERALGEAATRILQNGGYRTLLADSGHQALSLYADTHIDLLLTDVIMPEMSGRQLADTLTKRCPGLPVLYMSGYSDGLLGPSNILDDGLAFIEKPFTSAQLLTRVAEVLAVSAANPADTPSRP